MIRAPRLVVSRPMYAFDPTSWFVNEEHSVRRVDAVWFKRRDGVLVATVGWYYPMTQRLDQRPAADTYEAWIAAADDNRYGGAWLARSNGNHVWFSHDRYLTADESTRARELLEAMHRTHPDPPPGYDGWWTFELSAR